MLPQVAAGKTCSTKAAFSSAEAEGLRPFSVHGWRLNASLQTACLSLLRFPPQAVPGLLHRVEQLVLQQEVAPLTLPSAPAAGRGPASASSRPVSWPAQWRGEGRREKRFDTGDRAADAVGVSSRPASPTQLILALDVPSQTEALSLLRPVAGELVWVKLGLQLFLREGPGVVEAVADMGFHVFLDLKLHDIPNTVASAIRSLRGLPVGLLTLHASGGDEMIQRAKEAAADALPEAHVLAVTVLTSMNAANLRKIGVPDEPEAQVRRLAALALAAGADGLVCSPRELAPLRTDLGPHPLLVTPGIRPTAAASGDQKRVMTPAEARDQGASHIVVGRPILGAADPIAATRAILAELCTEPTDGSSR